MKKIKKYITILLSVLMASGFQSCKEEIDISDRYTFTEETLASYLEKHSDTYSEYYRILGEVFASSRSESTVLQLISARGNYTVFAPTNQAIQEYLESLRVKGLISTASWDGFENKDERDSIQKVIAYNSIIDCGNNEGFYTSSFPGTTEKFEELSISNMNDRRLTTGYYNNHYVVNGTIDPESKNLIEGSLIDLNNQDIPTINGILHQVHSVIAPSNETVADAFDNIIKLGKNLTGMAHLIFSCQLEKTLSKFEDKEYEEKYLAGEIPVVTHRGTCGECPQPERYKYGFTIFAETDDFWAAELGVNPKELERDEMARRVKDWVIQKGLYPDAVNDEDYSNPKNVLNQFVTYHILPARIPVNLLVVHYNEYGYQYRTDNQVSPLGSATWEFHTTMGKRRLLKIYESAESNGIYLNRFPTLDNERQGTYHEISCDPDKRGFLINTSTAENLVNGYIYPITRDNDAVPAALAYTEETRDNLQKYRIRFDATTMLPELWNNNLKLTYNTNPESTKGYWGFNADNINKYLENVSIMENTDFAYLAGKGSNGTYLGWENLQGDELNVSGNYEMTFKLPPVPRKGTYEIRYGVQSQGDMRGMCQVYFGSDTEHLVAMGIPLELRLGDSTHPLQVWEKETDDDVYNAEVDKKMRNYGFMKGPKAYYAGYKGSQSGNDHTARHDASTTRRIIVRQDMDPDKTYYLKFKSVLNETGKEFYMDYLEYCAKEVYDNPARPEDIW